MLRWPAIALILLMLGCGAPREDSHLLGNWTGRFKRDARSALADGGDFSGFLQLYASKNKCKLSLSNRYQSLEATGYWRLEEGRVRLSLDEITFGGMDQETRTARNVQIVPTDTLRSTYLRGLSLKVSEDGKRLIGQDLAIGPLTGRHEFEMTERAVYR